MLGKPAVTAEFKRRHYTADQVAELGSGNVMRVSRTAIDARKPGA
ncbi:dipeptidase [Sphingomonas sp. Leaf242]|nr:dipeptidase [Sphingomonas sp. Leaf242]